MDFVFILCSLVCFGLVSNLLVLTHFGFLVLDGVIDFELVGFWFLIFFGLGSNSLVFLGLLSFPFESVLVLPNFGFLVVTGVIDFDLVGFSGLCISLVRFRVCWCWRSSVFIYIL